MRAPWLPAALLLLGACGGESPPAPPAVSDFVRFVDAGEHRGRLEVAIVRYRHPPTGATIELTSAVHIGDASYYAALTRRFAACDAVLYELVAPEGTRPEAAAAGGDSLVSMLQRALTSTLELRFQLEAVDYSPDNFVHADLSAADMQRLWAERGESLWTMLLRLLASSMQMQQEGSAQVSTHELLAALFAKDRARRLKWVLGQQMEHIEQMLAMFGGGENSSGSVLVGARNARAVDVLRAQLAAGRRNLSIFYGAAHMPDLEQRLQRDLGCTLDSHQWLPAWTIE